MWIIRDINIERTVSSVTYHNRSFTHWVNDCHSDTCYISL